MSTTVEETDRTAQTNRGRKWWMIIGGVIVLLMLLNYKPQRYRDETMTMRLIASVVKGPVIYERFEGWSTCPYVNTVYLPRADLTENEIADLAELLQKLPRLNVVEVSLLLEEQRTQVDQLDDLLPESIFLSGQISRGGDSREETAFVAGLTR